jgi:hypothetical protein
MLFPQYEASEDETNAREETRKGIAEQLNQRVAKIQGGLQRAERSKGFWRVIESAPLPLAK